MKSKQGRHTHAKTEKTQNFIGISHMSTTTKPTFFKQLFLPLMMMMHPRTNLHLEQKQQVSRSKVPTKVLSHECCKTQPVHQSNEKQRNYDNKVSDGKSFKSALNQTENWFEQYLS